MAEDQTRRAKRGPDPLPAAERRGHCVSVRLNAAELAQLDECRGAFQRGEWLRMAALDELPPTIPPVNLEAWATLAKSAGNLATIANAMRGGDYIEADRLRQVVAEFRSHLIGTKQGESDE